MLAMAHGTHRGHRMALGSQFSPSTMLEPGTKFRDARFSSKCLLKELRAVFLPSSWPPG